MRGGYILAIIITAILVESAVQYIVYLTEPNDKYHDYACLHLQFEDEGYHPTVFEALFFLLLGLSIIAGIMALVWMLHNRKTKKEATTTNSVIPAQAKHIASWVNQTRIFIQTVAIVVMWVELVYLWKIRRIMSKIAGATWSEGSWGFGQILALFIWFPPIIDILSRLGKLYPIYLIP
jgi:hypothetical protein